jgi:putative glutathione S-transferase
VLGIRGGPVLPVDIVNDEAFGRPLVAQPGRYALIYSPVTPSGQKVALVAALYGLLDLVTVLVPRLGRLEAIDDPVGYRWSEAVTAVERHAIRIGSTLRTPTLVDVESGQALSNDPYLLPYALRELARHRPPSGPGYLSLTAPEAIEREWDARIFEDFHVGVYRAGFVRDPEVYQRTVSGVHQFLVDLDERLEDQEFLHGDVLVPSDLWLFSLLVRFDQVYGPGFRLHRYRLRDFPQVWRYLRQLYAIPACSFTTDFPAISEGYYLGIPILNRGIVPIGPDDLFLRR